MDTHILPLKTVRPPFLEIIYNQIHVVQFICTHYFPQQRYPSNKLKQPPPPPPFRIHSRHQKLPLYQILLIFNVELPPHAMNLTPVPVLLLLNSLPFILPIIINTEILPPL